MVLDFDRIQYWLRYGLLAGVNLRNVCVHHIIEVALRQFRLTRDATDFHDKRVTDLRLLLLFPRPFLARCERSRTIHADENDNQLEHESESYPFPGGTVRG